MSRYRKSWTQVLQEVYLGEALKKIDKDVIDAFYYKKEKAGKVVSTDGDSLWKNGLGGQEIAIWTGRKIKITAVSDVKSTESIIKYIRKSIPSGILEEVEIDEEVFNWYIIKGNFDKGKIAFVGNEKQVKLKRHDPKFGGDYVMAKSRKDLKIGDKWKRSMGVSEEVEEGVTGPTRMDVQKHFDKEKGLLRARINATEKALKISDIKVDAKGTVQSFKEEVENEGWGAVAKFADSQAAAAKKKKETAANKKVSSWAKGRKEEVTHFGDILRQAIEEAKKVDAIKEINKIVKTKTMGKLHGQKVDLFTASAIQQVYKAINHKNKEKMNSVMSKDIHGLLKMADFSMSKMKR